MENKYTNSYKLSIKLLLLIIIFLSVYIINGQISPDKKNYPKSPSKVNSGVQMKEINLGGLTQADVINILSQSARRKNTNPQNAFIFKQKIFPEKLGKRLNIQVTTKQILTAPPNKKIKPVYDYILPTITEKVLKKGKQSTINLNKDREQKKTINSKLITHYTTYLSDNKPNRRNNIRLALKNLNKYYLAPNQEFSFNQLIGIPTLNKGYKKAPTIDSGKIIPKVGGGICQVSSTLYNVVQRANLNITEHHTHSKRVNYVPAGQDATIYPKEKDFKFINNSSQPLIILTDLIDRYVIIYLLQKVDTN